MSDILVVAAWLGPNKMFNPSQGKSYVFGIFTVTPQRLTFAASDGTLPIDVARSEATVEWPFWLMGGACRLTTPATTGILSFGRPFPNAPLPEQESVDRALATLEGVHQQPMETLRAAIVIPEEEMTDAKMGRVVGAQVKATLS
ncbi:hypothetical protein [Actinoplanes sp. G11-F43]|uniref:hypothetical protein n=1 Tax=Actinoplanes sp. G11-F43 TaxID=3424130 RepID=UPI003D32D89A